jgi:hypothetical protein
MDDFDVVDELEAGPGKQKAPMLHVLCILTWVYCFFSILFLSLFLFNGTNLMSMISESGNDTLSSIFLWNGLMPLVCAGGALMMWFKLPWGIVVYGVGQLAPVIYNFVIFLSAFGFDSYGVFFVVISNLIPIAFFVLYATQVKYMKPWHS